MMVAWYNLLHAECGGRGRPTNRAQLNMWANRVGDLEIRPGMAMQDWNVWRSGVGLALYNEYNFVLY